MIRIPTIFVSNQHNMSELFNIICISMYNNMSHAHYGLKQLISYSLFAFNNSF